MAKPSQVCRRRRRRRQCRRRDIQRARRLFDGQFNLVQFGFAPRGLISIPIQLSWQLWLDNDGFRDAADSAASRRHLGSDCWRSPCESPLRFFQEPLASSAARGERRAHVTDEDDDDERRPLNTINHQYAMQALAANSRPRRRR